MIPLGACFTDFIPFNEQELAFADFIKLQQNGKASWGYVLGSKGGIIQMYEFIQSLEATCDQENYFSDSQIIFHGRFINDEFKAAVELYMQLYTRLIRNAIYFTMPYGGVYITNRVALNNPELFEDHAFLQDLFDCKNESLTKLIAQMPIFLVKDHLLNIYSAACYLLVEG